MSSVFRANTIVIKYVYCCEVYTPLSAALNGMRTAGYDARASSRLIIGPRVSAQDHVSHNALSGQESLTEVIHFMEGTPSADFDVIIPYIPTVPGRLI